jgi:glycosyltransferase involved in cell wall biosynthesis
MSFYIDLSEFLGNPITTGIQRIAGEICKYLPPNTAIPVRLHASEFVALPPALIEAIGRHFGDVTRSGVGEINRLGAVEGATRVILTQEDIVLVPEVFNNPPRLALFRQMPEQQFERCRFIVYDLLPMTHPQYFPPNTSAGAFAYYRMLGAASCCGFISEETRNDYYGRLKRSDDRGGVVLPLGCDSLGPRPRQATLNRPLTFSVLGTIEPRKNHELILDAFQPLLGEIAGLRLSFIGKMGWVDSEFSQKVHTLAADENSGFRFHSVSGDDDIRRCIERSRATLYVSSAEGYGLPPVESLWVGTPVIASAMIPSLNRLGSQGIHYVEPLSVVNLRRAVLEFMDDDYANRKTEEAMTLDLPTWKSFTKAVLSWCNSMPGDDSGNAALVRA